MDPSPLAVSARPATIAAPADRAWETVLRRIESDLVDGVLSPGDHLPSERALAVELGVGRSSVREALRVLEVLGLIRTQSGSGPQSGAIIVARPSGGMAALMRFQVAAQGFAVADVVKTRLVLEAAVVGDLASSTPDLAQAVELLDVMDSGAAASPGAGAELPAAAFLALDAAFHLALAAASGNEVIASMMSGLRNSIESYVLAGAPSPASWDATAARLRHEHRDILAAITARDADTARTRIHSHIVGYYTESNLLAAP